MTITSGETPTNRAIGIEPAGGSSNSINEYDSWNQLTKTMQNGKTASYTYNGDGLRMSKTVGGTTTSHIWDGTNIAGGCDERNSYKVYPRFAAYFVEEGQQRELL